MTEPVCPCDGDLPAAPTNLPQLSHIAYRHGTWLEFRRAVLTPLDGETSLSLDGHRRSWRTQGQGDLAVMMAEWFAYLGDILTFYNERIANQDYLRTADLPESVNHLIRLLGYRPRPAIGATGILAALVNPGQSAVLPKGLQIQSKPGPGQAPQTFELSADTAIALPDQVAAAPPPYTCWPRTERAAAALPRRKPCPHGLAHRPGASSRSACCGRSPGTTVLLIQGALKTDRPEARSSGCGRATPRWAIRCWRPSPASPSSRRTAAASRPRWASTSPGPRQAPSAPPRPAWTRRTRASASGTSSPPGSSAAQRCIWPVSPGRSGRGTGWR